LKRLFRDQQQFLDYFFKNLDYEQVNPLSLWNFASSVCGIVFAVDGTLSHNAHEYST
jgi:hypothetical protein